MFRKKRRMPADGDLPWMSVKPIPLPAALPPLAGVDDHDEYAPHHRPRTWLWTLVAALVVALGTVFVLGAGVKGALDGLRDRTEAGQRIAKEHYELGVAYLQAGNYELAIAEFGVAGQLDPNLPGLKRRLREAKQFAQAQVTPTSEARTSAAEGLYRQAVAFYQDGNLGQAVLDLEEVRSLDADYQREQVETMLVTAYYQLGLNALREDRLKDARSHFEDVLALQIDPALQEQAQQQLNLLNLYMAALSHWESDWASTIHALKGLYALAPDYKDVRVRLHDAYVFYGLAFAAEQDWCPASAQFSAAAEVFPLETTVDRRDDALIQCQTASQTTEPGTPVPARTARPTARPAGAATPTPMPAATTPQPAVSLGKGRLVLARYDALRQRHDIYQIDLALGTTQTLQESADQPAFAPGGKRLAFHDENPAHLGLDILDLPTGQQSELTTHAEDFAPTWSPDATQILFASAKYGDGKWRLYVISPEAVRGEGEQWAFGQMPAWSPASDRIAYHGCDEQGNNCSIWTMSAGGYGPARLTTHPSDTAPSWSSDGSQVVYVSARSGNWELYWVDVATGQERRLTEHPGTDVAPVWSPDNRRIAFLSDREGPWAVYSLEVKSGLVQKIQNAGDPYPDPVSERMVWLP